MTARERFGEERRSGRPGVPEGVLCRVTPLSLYSSARTKQRNEHPTPATARRQFVGERRANADFGLAADASRKIFVATGMLVFDFSS